MPVDISDVRRIVEAQENWRGRETINLIASENAQSPAVREIQNSDFMARYAEGHPNRGDEVLRYYQGTKLHRPDRDDGARGAAGADEDAPGGRAARSPATPPTPRSPWATCAAATPSSSTRRPRAGTSATTPSASSGGASRTAAPRSAWTREKHIPLHFFPLAEDMLPPRRARRAST